MVIRRAKMSEKRKNNWPGGGTKGRELNRRTIAGTAAAVYEKDQLTFFGGRIAVADLGVMERW